MLILSQHGCSLDIAKPRGRLYLQPGSIDVLLQHLKPQLPSEVFFNCQSSLVFPFFIINFLRVAFRVFNYVFNMGKIWVFYSFAISYSARSLT